MTDPSLLDLIPTSKHAVERADRAVERGYPAVAAILPELIEWLQDLNWPVAGVLAPFLASIGMPLVPEIRRILNTDDDVWKYWVLTCLIKAADVAVALREQLVRLAVQPTASEKAEEVDYLARQILDEFVLSGQQ